jgi:hypothetical protein
MPNKTKEVVKKKRGRPSKKNKKIAQAAASDEATNCIAKPKKKRGRKPRGGKIVELKKKSEKTNEKIQINCILHLKCSSKEINKNLQSIKFNANADTIEPFILSSNKNKTMQYNEIDNGYKKNNNIEYQPDDSGGKDLNLKEIWGKLRELKYKLHSNDIMDKKSDCFWCTCGFSNPPVYIPKKERNGILEVYGCFCSPECAVSHLKNEPIDTSTRWERYSLLNNIYCKIYSYEKNIKPAPDPYYTLDKYYGNLSIQEYRKLLLNDRLLLVVDKPLTKIMPELYEESHENPLIYNDILNNNTSTNKKKKYRLQRKNKKVSKKNIMSANFNMT